MTGDQPSSTSQPARVIRPLGLTIALLATAVLYGVLPLLEIYFLKRLDATAEEAYLLGGVTIDTWKWFQGGFGAIMLAICTLAWWGRPRGIRLALIVLLLVLTATNLYRIVEAWMSAVDPIFGGPTQEALRGYLRCQFPAMVLVPLYVVWYLSRAPARAFYRQVPLEWLSRDGDRELERPPGEETNT